MLGDGIGLNVRLRSPSVALGVGCADRSARRPSCFPIKKPLVTEGVGLTAFSELTLLLRLSLPRIVFPLSEDVFPELADDLDDMISSKEPIETVDGTGETVRDLASACHLSTAYLSTSYRLLTLSLSSTRSLITLRACRSFRIAASRAPTAFSNSGPYVVACLCNSALAVFNCFTPSLSRSLSASRCLNFSNPSVSMRLVRSPSLACKYASVLLISIIF